MTTPAHTFSVPPDGESYVSNIIDRCYDLIDTAVWQGIDKARLNAWLANFSDSMEERYFACVVLDALIYRSHDQTLSLLVQLFQRVLPDLHRKAWPGVTGINDWIVALQNPNVDCGTRLVPVIRDDDPPTKSGPLVARLLKRHLRLREDWMIWPWQVSDALKQGVSMFVFIDDFLGTGWQFRGFLDRMRLNEHLKQARFLYAPLVAHTKGLAALSKEAPEIKCSAVEILEEHHGLFSKDGYFFRDGVNSPKSAREFYLQLLHRHGLTRLGKKAFGYGRLGVACAFEHAAPNASLPLLWLDANGWTPLFDR